MLRVTVELIPGGRESGKRTLAVAEIANTGGASMAHYRVELGDELPGLKHADIREYPRWSASVWDLALRCVAKALYGEEQLPRRPPPVAKLVPTHTEDGRVYPFVLMVEIPEPARGEFARRMAHSTVPMRGAAYLHDWQDFLRGHR